MATIATGTDVYRDKLTFHGLGPEALGEPAGLRDGQPTPRALAGGARGVPLRGGDTLEVQAHFRGRLIATHHLDDNAREGRGKRRAQYVIGATAEADAPVAQELIGGASLPLITTWGQDYLVNVTPQMGGELWVDGRAVRLQDYVRERGRSFTLPRQSRARVECGQVVFVLGRTHKAEQVPRHWLALRWAEHKYTAAAAMGLGLLLLAMLAIPPDARSLSLESLAWDKNYLPSVAIPAVEEKVPDWLTARRPDGRGDEGKAHVGDPGKMGSKTSNEANKRYAVKGPENNRNPYMSKQAAEERALNSGILGMMNKHNSKMASIFGREMALGNDPEDVLGNLIGAFIGEAGGVGGLGPLGTGAGGGGTGQGTLGGGSLATLGSAGRGSGGEGGYGQHVGLLTRPRRTIVPEVVPGVVTVRGSLDKEIIRRIVRQHMNEVKYCYDQELARKPALAGRISVQFAISPLGQVLTSVMQSTSMNDARVENCVVNAVRRWEFPKPVGAGMVIVLYPFSFTSPTS